jgi:hypothetical protein
MMQQKGIKTQLEPICRQAYIDGQSLTAIEEMYGGIQADNLRVERPDKKTE